jgi:hypothetical protein
MLVTLSGIVMLVRLGSVRRLPIPDAGDRFSFNCSRYN